MHWWARFRHTHKSFTYITFTWPCIKCAVECKFSFPKIKVKSSSLFYERKKSSCETKKKMNFGQKYHLVILEQKSRPCHVQPVVDCVVKESTICISTSPHTNTHSVARTIYQLHFLHSWFIYIRSKTLDDIIDDIRQSIACRDFVSFNHTFFFLFFVYFIHHSHHQIWPVRFELK